MTMPVICTGEMLLLTSGDLSCSGDWQVYESDIMEFASLLNFDPVVFGLLFGAAAVLFIVGYSAGATIRQITRV